MKTVKFLRLRLRIMEGVTALALAGSLTAAVSTHQLLLDAANHPTSVFDLTSTNVQGTLDAGRMPPGLALDPAANYGIHVGGYVSTQSSGGQIDTSGSGGFIQTNGYGAPTDSNTPTIVGSIYMDQDPSGASGHVLWVCEPSGWVGK